MTKTSLASRKGLATVALLKVHYDSGEDHIGMFIPFVADAVRHLGEESPSSLEQIHDEIEKLHGLSIPRNSLQTLLSRARKKKYVRLEAGLYSPGSKAPERKLSDEKARLDREHMALANNLKEYALEKHDLDLESTENALDTLLSFLTANHLMMLTGDPWDASAGEAMTHREAAVVADFVQEKLRSDPERADYLQRMLEGFVLQNALLLRDINETKRKFRKLCVYLDSGFLLRALGLAGDAHKLAARELLQVLRASGALLGAFRRTVNEVERILAV